MPIYTNTGAFNVAVNDTTGTGRYSASGALRINLVTGASYVGLYAADGALNVVDVSGVNISTYGGLYHPSGAIRGRTAPTTLSGLQAPDGSYYFLGLFSPLNLFANGEQGAWYEPSDFDRYIAPLGSELVTNGDFSSGTTGWSTTRGAIANVGGELQVTNSGTTYARGEQAVTCVVGKWYEATAWARVGTTPVAYFDIRSGTVAGASVASASTSSSSATKLTLRFLANNTTMVIVLACDIGTNATAFFDNVSVRELTAIDTATMYQDAAGTTPVTAVEQPVGLVLDKSKGLALGAELVTNGDFSSNTWWSTGGGAAISGGALNFTAAVATSGAYRLGFATVGKYYELTFEIISISSGGIQITLGTSSGTNRTAAGVYTQRILCTGNGNLTLYSVGASTTASVDNVSIKEVQGNHASQSTAASRPVLSARVNLLTYSEQFDNAAWVKSNITVTANQAIAPNGTLTMDAAAEIAGTGIHAIRQASISIPAGSTLIGAAYVKANGRSVIGFRIDDGANGAGKNFDLSAVTTGNTISVGSGASLVSSSITSVGDGVYLCVARVTLPSGATTANFSVDLKTSDASTWTQSYTGDGTSGIYIWGADLRPTNVGVGLPAYQRVGAAVTATTNPAVTGVPDYDTSGFPLYLKFDGTDDSLTTGTIDFTATDKMSVFAGVRKLSDAATGIVSELSSGSLNGSFSLFAPANTGANSYRWGCGAGTIVNVGTGVFAAAPDTSALTGIGNISGDISTIRRNGALVATDSTTDQGTGNFGNYPLYIGRRNNFSLPFNGNLYSLIVRGALSTDAQIASTETYVNSKTGAY